MEDRDLNDAAMARGRRHVEAVADQPTSLSRAIREAREAGGLSQARLANAVGADQAAVSRWESGREPSLEMIHEIEAALGRPRGYLLKVSGHVDIDVDPITAIRGDPEMDPNYIPLFVNMYESLKEKLARQSAERAVTAMEAQRAAGEREAK